MTITIFFSNFDGDCKRLSDLIRNGNNSLSKIIKPVCIDYKEIHDIITTSTNIKISTVPTLLVENNNQIELYEGNESFEYIEQVIENINSENSKPQKNEKTDISDLWVGEPVNTEENNISKGVVDDRKKITAKDIQKERELEIPINSPTQEVNRY